MLIFRCRSFEGIWSRERCFVRRLWTSEIYASQRKQMYNKFDKERCLHTIWLDRCIVPICVKYVNGCSGWATGDETGRQRLYWLSSGFQNLTTKLFQSTFMLFEQLFSWHINLVTHWWSPYSPLWTNQFEPWRKNHVWTVFWCWTTELVKDGHWKLFLGMDLANWLYIVSSFCCKVLLYCVLTEKWQLKWTS